jgi:deoxyribose-phosphate aldolase
MKQQLSMAAYIDHTLLKPNATQSQIVQLCAEALTYGFASVCIFPYFIPLAKRQLANSDVNVATVIGFPFGSECVSSKIEDIKRCVDHGADEIDAVINLQAMLNQDWDFIKAEIESLTMATHMHSKKIKIIIETCYLNPESLEKVCDACAKAKVDFVKTSTGYGTAGAKVEDIVQIKSFLPKNIGIKASGGISSQAYMLELIEAGATRIGSSASVAMMA